jgi:hypothetical protein
MVRTFDEDFPSEAGKKLVEIKQRFLTADRARDPRQEQRVSRHD